MTALIGSLNADVVLLQEVFAVPDRGINTASAIAGSLGFNFAFHPARKKSRAFAGEFVVSHSGMAVLSRHAIVDSRAIDLPSDVADGERIAQVATVVVGSPVRFVNVHLTHLPDRQALRQRQLTAAVQAARVESAEPFIVGGDFNDWIDDAWLAPVVSTCGASIVNTRGPCDSDRAPTLLSTALQEADAAHCVDHVLLVGASAGREAAVVSISHLGDLSASDHRAVRVVLSPSDSLDIRGGGRRLDPG